MTHDELLAKITSNADAWAEPSFNANALRAVVELHRPVGENGNYSKCIKCDAIYNKCKTIQAIEKELR
jgi:succinate dehydrogenase/fumarate reductase-like Fe-S protein